MWGEEGFSGLRHRDSVGGALKDVHAESFLSTGEPLTEGLLVDVGCPSGGGDALVLRS